jgi:hypothetical protein
MNENEANKFARDQGFGKLFESVQKVIQPKTESLADEDDGSLTEGAKEYPTMKPGDAGAHKDVHTGLTHHVTADKAGVNVKHDFGNGYAIRVSHPWGAAKGNVLEGGSPGHNKDHQRRLRSAVKVAHALATKYATYKPSNESVSEESVESGPKVDLVEDTVDLTEAALHVKSPSNKFAIKMHPSKDFAGKWIVAVTPSDGGKPNKTIHESRDEAHKQFESLHRWSGVGHVKPMSESEVLEEQGAQVSESIENLPLEEGRWDDIKRTRSHAILPTGTKINGAHPEKNELHKHWQDFKASHPAIHPSGSSGTYIHAMNKENGKHIVISTAGSPEQQKIGSTFHAHHDQNLRHLGQFEVKQAVSHEEAHKLPAGSHSLYVYK